MTSAKKQPKLFLDFGRKIIQPHLSSTHSLLLGPVTLSYASAGNTFLAEFELSRAYRILQVYCQMEFVLDTRSFVWVCQSAKVSCKIDLHGFQFMTSYLWFVNTQFQIL